MVYNYNKLQGRIKEHYKTQQEFAKHLGISQASMCDKLNGKKPFKQDEIFKSIELLKLAPEEIQTIFFNKQVENMSTN